MIEMTIKRVVTGLEGTFGVIMLGNTPFALTLEREWRNNQKGISCIPAGNYIAQRCRTAPEYSFQDSPKFGDTFVVTEVEGRDKILFHKGNIDEDSHGCILVGEQFGSLRDDTAILASKAGFGEFLRILKGYDTFKLSIINTWI